MYVSGEAAAVGVAVTGGRALLLVSESHGIYYIAWSGRAGGWLRLCVAMGMIWLRTGAAFVVHTSLRRTTGAACGRCGSGR